MANGLKISLSQEQADELINLLKKFKNDFDVYEIPVWEPLHGARNRFEIVANNEDSRYGQMFHEIQIKGKSKEEENKTLTFVHKMTNNCLCRLDYGENVPPHSNSDGQVIVGPHLHLYKEGLDDTFAIALEEIFPHRKGDTVGLVKQFLEYCHISYKGITFQESLL